MIATQEITAPRMVFSSADKTEQTSTWKGRLVKALLVGLLVGGVAAGVFLGVPLIPFSGSDLTLAASAAGSGAFLLASTVYFIYLTWRSSSKHSQQAERAKAKPLHQEPRVEDEEPSTPLARASAAPRSLRSRSGRAPQSPSFPREAGPAEVEFLGHLDNGSFAIATMDLSRITREAFLASGGHAQIHRVHLGNGEIFVRRSLLPESQRSYRVVEATYHTLNLARLFGHNPFTSHVTHYALIDRIPQTFYPLAAGSLLDQLKSTPGNPLGITYWLDQPDSTTRLIQWCQQLINGLHFIHEKGIIHRDLKPENILVYKDGKELRIHDFEAAIAEDQFRSLPSVLDGTTHRWCSPEMVEASREDSFDLCGYRIDSWALGLILYLLITRNQNQQNCNMTEVQKIISALLNRTSRPYDPTQIQAALEKDLGKLKERLKESERVNGLSPRHARSLEEICIGLSHIEPSQRWTTHQATRVAFA